VGKPEAECARARIVFVRGKLDERAARDARLFVEWVTENELGVFLPAHFDAPVGQERLRACFAGAAPHLYLIHIFRLACCHGRS
jgi:hypothetical protein